MTLARRSDSRRSGIVPALAHGRLDIGDLKSGFVVAHSGISGSEIHSNAFDTGTSPIRFSTSSTLKTDSMSCASITLVFIMFSWLARISMDAFAATAQADRFSTDTVSNENKSGGRPKQRPTEDRASPFVVRRIVPDTYRSQHG